MKVSYIVLEAWFDTKEDEEYVRKHWNVSPVNITEAYVHECKKRSDATYMFIGSELDLVKYLVFGYKVNDLEELEGYLKDIKCIEI